MFKANGANQEDNQTCVFYICAWLCGENSMVGINRNECAFIFKFGGNRRELQQKPILRPCNVNCMYTKYEYPDTT